MLFNTGFWWPALPPPYYGPVLVGMCWGGPSERDKWERIGGGLKEGDEGWGVMEWEDGKGGRISEGRKTEKRASEEELEAWKKKKIFIVIQTSQCSSHLLFVFFTMTLSCVCRFVHILFWCHLHILLTTRINYIALQQIATSHKLITTTWSEHHLDSW